MTCIRRGGSMGIKEMSSSPPNGGETTGDNRTISRQRQGRWYRKIQRQIPTISHRRAPRGYSRSPIRHPRRRQIQRRAWLLGGRKASRTRPPFKNNEWARLALRHIIDIAHKEGHDSIAIDGGNIVSRWATGGGGVNRLPPVSAGPLSKRWAAQIAMPK